MTHTADSRLTKVVHSARQASELWREILGSSCASSDGGVADSCFDQIPVVDKGVVFDGGLEAMPRMLRAGDLGLAEAILFSSGSSGEERSFGLYDAAGFAREGQRLAEALLTVWGVRGRPLVIDMLPTSFGLHIPGAFVVSASTQVDLLRELLESLAPRFDTTVLVAEPWYLKHALEYVGARGVDLDAVELQIVVGGEYLPERLRRYLHGLLGHGEPAPRTRLLSSMGMSEIGLHLFWETEATAALRRRLASEPELRAVLCGRELPTAPCVMTFDSSRLYVEVIGEELVLTCLDPRRPQPMLRYNSHDRGAFIDHKVAAEALSASDPLLVDRLPKDLVWTYGRSSEPTVPVIAEAISGATEFLTLISGAFCLRADGCLDVQLMDDSLQVGLAGALEDRLRGLLAEVGVRQRGIRLWPFSAYPHTEPDVWSRKFRRTVG